MAHIPIRMCIVCRERFPKRQMKRYVIKEGMVIEDKKGTISGRGLYVCMKEECLIRWKNILKGKKYKLKTSI